MIEEPSETALADLPASRGRPSYWRKWMEGSVNRRVFGATVMLGCLTLLAKVAMTGRDVLVAKIFGTGDAMDAFVMAFSVINCIVTLLMSSINYSLIPTFIRTRENDGHASAQRVLSNIMVLGLGTLVTFALLLGIGSRWILGVLAGGGFDESKLFLTQALFFIMLPGLVVSGITSSGSAILNSEKRFLVTGITPVITPVLTAILIVAWPGRDYASGTRHLASFVCAGYGCEFLVIMTMLARRGYSLRPRWSGIDPATREILAQCGWRVAAAVLFGGIPLVEQAMAARLGTGNVSLLSYANKLLGVILGIGGTLLATVVLPHLSHAIANNDWATVRLMVSKYSKLIFIVSLPAMAGLVIFAEPMLKLFFEHGAFTHDSTIQVSHLQMIYALQIPFYILCFFYATLCCAVNAAYIMVWGNIINLSLSFVMNYYLSRWLGLSGIAITSVSVYACSALFLRLVLGRKISHVFTPGPGLK